MNRITRGLKHSWRIKRKQNCYSSILFTLFTCFVSSLFTKKSLVVHWITKQYVWNDNFNYIPEFFFFFVIVDLRWFCVRQSRLQQNSTFCDSKVLDIQVFPIKTKFKILWELSSSDFFYSINKCGGCCITCFFCFILSFVISFCEYLLLALYFITGSFSVYTNEYKNILKQLFFFHF